METNKMWRKIEHTDPQDLDLYVQHIRNGAPHYFAKYKAQDALRFANNDRGVLYWYEGGVYQIALTLYVETNGQEVKLANCLVFETPDDKGKGDPREAVKIVVRKLREYMDEHKIEYAYAYTPVSPFTPFQDQFHNEIDNMVWEHRKVLTEDGSMWKRHVERDPLRHNEDELWIHK